MQMLSKYVRAFIKQKYDIAPFGLLYSHPYNSIFQKSLDNGLSQGFSVMIQPSLLDQQLHPRL